MADPVFSYQYPSHPLSRKPLKRNQEVFRPFLRYTEPEPVPSRAQFYLENLTNNAVKSYEEGFIRYFKDLKERPTHGLAIGALAAGLGLAFTAFQRHATLIKMGVLLSFLGYPVMAAIHHLPKMVESYELAKQGEPTKAKAEFRQSRDELFFQIFHNYLKPLTLGLGAYYLLNFRRTLLLSTRKLLQKARLKLDRNPTELLKPLSSALKRLGNTLKRLSKNPSVLFQDRTAKRLEHWGDQVAAPISHRLPQLG